MGKLYPVEQRHTEAAQRYFGYPLSPADAAHVIDAATHFARFEAEHLTRIEATPAVDRETLKRAIADGYSGGNEQYDEAPSHVQALYDMAVDAIMALPPVKQSDGLAERVKEAEIADRAYERLEGHFRSLAHIASHTLDCNADDVRKLEDSAEFVARYRKEQRHVHG